jgi:hypothetical protein
MRAASRYRDVLPMHAASYLDFRSDILRIAFLQRVAQLVSHVFHFGKKGRDLEPDVQPDVNDAFALSHFHVGILLD